jgi:hypothetical protein
MFIQRDLLKSKVPDFIKNVQPLLNGSKIAEEVYDENLRSMVIGWEICDINRKDIIL